MANSVDQDEMAHYEPSHLDLHCLHRHLFRSTKLKGQILCMLGKTCQQPTFFNYFFYFSQKIGFDIS